MSIKEKAKLDASDEELVRLNNAIEYDLARIEGIKNSLQNNLKAIKEVSTYEETATEEEKIEIDARLEEITIKS
ncbi:MAG: hypothetical protein HOG49_03115 [Candidatus Scalindua sp.]|jgi:hypothetical protein|nr:hypothetical protein [Candidatus Scalindua sp.]